MDATAIIVACINAGAMIVVALVVNRVRKDVHKVEVATNSRKDALVAGAHREGIIEGKRREKDSPS